MSLAKHMTDRGILNINGEEVDIGTSNHDDDVPLHKGLNIYPGEDGKTELVSREPTKEIISKTVRELDWDDMSFVNLVIEEDHRVEVSGSYLEGFSSLYKKGNIELFANPPPASIGEIESILHVFIENQEEVIEKYGFAEKIL